MADTTAIYLKLGDVVFPGIATHPSYRGWIPVESAKLGSGAPREGTSGAEASGLHDVVITKLVNKSTAPIAQFCASGKIFAGATIDFCAVQGKLARVRVRYKYTKVQVTRFRLVRGGKGTPDVEEIQLNYEDVTWQYSAPPSGS